MEQPGIDSRAGMSAKKFLLPFEFLPLAFAPGLWHAVRPMGNKNAPKREAKKPKKKKV
jgi:hypothetical protein